MGADRIELSDRVVDLALHQVVQDGTATPLSKTEVALLRYLRDHGDGPVSKEELHVAVFGYAPQVVSRAADFTVHRLRKKLEADPSDPRHLRTSPGVGYRLDVGAVAAPPEVPPTPPTGGLPVERTSFLGRKEELAEVLEALGASGRLVTLVGPGGVGKTRLALRAASGWQRAHAHPAAFCDLSLVREEAAVSGAVALALGVDPSLGTDPVARLGALFAAGPRLLVLDNAEQIIAPLAAAVRRWRAAAPQLTLLVTSRERLRVDGEQLIELHPLDPEAAAALFVERARTARPTFRLQDPHEEAELDRLVRRLDGLPLAIELAASRSAVLSPRQMLDRWASPDALARAPRDAPDRQATLDQAFEWSWSLLAPAEQRALAQLTAFRGPFDVDDAEAVVDLGDGSPVAERVLALREKSLLVEVPGEGPPRFTLLQALREFAERRCDAVESLWLRHAAWVVGITREASWQRLHVNTHAEGVLERAHGDLVAAVDRLARLDVAPALRADALVAVHSTWSRSGAPEGFLERADGILAVGDTVPRESRVRLHLARASLLQPSGGGPVAEASCRAVLELAPDEVGAEERALAHLLLASFHHRAHRFEAAWSENARAREALAGRPPSPLHARVEIQCGNLGIEQKRFDVADGHFRGALAWCERAEVPALVPLIYTNLAVLRGWQDRQGDQAAMARRALLAARERGQRVLERRALLLLTVAESELGRLDDAARHGADALALALADHAPDLACDAEVALAGIEFARENLDAVAQHVRGARRLSAHARAPWHRAYVVYWDALAGWARWGSLREAAELLEEALGLAQGHMPHGEVLIESKLVAARMHLDGRAAHEAEAAWWALEERARAAGRPGLAAAVAVDRLHLDLARAARARADGGDPAVHLAPVVRALRGRGVADIEHEGLAVTWSRVLLASAFAELEHADPETERIEGRRA